MLKHVLPAVTCSLLAILLAGDVPWALAQKPKELQWSHAFDLKCRKLGMSEFDKDSPKFGVEVFKDNNTGLGLYISQVGSIGVAPGFANSPAPVPKAQGPDWITGLDLQCRKAGQKAFDKSTPIFAMEVFRDPNAGSFLYITEKGLLAVNAARGGPASAGKAPKWIHSVDLRCRKAGFGDWKDAPKFGIEVYRDQITNNWVYVCETGAIAIAPAGDVTVPEEGKAPEWLHSLNLKCRKHDEPNFTKDTKVWGLEVFRDEVLGNLIYISEVGTIAVTSAKKDLKAPTTNVKDPQWTHGLNLKVRPAGQPEFTQAKTFGAEVFHDDNTGVTVYIAETGSIAAQLTK
jgi:hypothetical protein